MTSPRFRVEHPDSNVHVVRCDIKSQTSWDQWFLLRSDAHHDNPDCDREMEYKHLDQAMQRGAGILDAGDLFCAMQGKYDRRSDKSKVRPEHQCGDYLDALVRTAAEDYAPYAKNWILMGSGNHEVSVALSHETLLLDRLVHDIKGRVKDTPLKAGGYGGFVRFMFTRGNERSSVRMSYFHGSGGGGPVTRGVIQTNRRSAMIEADIYWSGHVHEKTLVATDRAYLNDANVICQRRVEHVCTPGYKDEYHGGKGGWWVGTGKGPRRRGAAWLRFYWDRGLTYEILEAQ